MQHSRILSYSQFMIVEIMPYPSLDNTLYCLTERPKLLTIVLSKNSCAIADLLYLCVLKLHVMMPCSYMPYGVENQFRPAFPYQIITTEIMWCAIHHRIAFLKFGCKLIRLAPTSANTSVMLRNLNSSTINFPQGEWQKPGVYI